eukprot:6468491-Amphidinium_carterae.1
MRHKLFTGATGVEVGCSVVHVQDPYYFLRHGRARSSRFNPAHNVLVVSCINDHVVSPLPRPSSRKGHVAKQFSYADPDLLLKSLSG